MKGGLKQEMKGAGSCRIADKQRDRRLYEGKTEQAGKMLYGSVQPTDLLHENNML